MTFVDEEGRVRNGRSSAFSAALRVRPAIPADSEGVARLFVQCVGGQMDEHRLGFEQELRSARANNLVLVAEVEHEIIGFARARYFEPSAQSPENVAPPGWYLLGVNVAPAYRRRGVGAELTRARLRWIAERAGQAFYFTEEGNHASIALHARLGFEEIRRSGAYPGALPAESSRVLYRLDLSGW